MLQAIIALKLAQSAKTDDNMFHLHETKSTSTYFPKKTNTFGVLKVDFDT